MDADAIHQWGRIDADGTVFVRTAAGDRPVGSWQAGAPEEGLAHFARRYDELAAHVDLIRQRLESGVADPADLRKSATRLRASLPTAAAVGDLDALDRQLGELIEQAGARIAARSEERAARRAEAADALRRLAEEAERLAQSTQWKATGDRLRAIVEEWKEAAHGVDRKTASEIWHRFAAARDEFHRRRGAHFAARDDERQSAQARKEALAAQAESLAESSEWGATASRFRELMTEWKTAGHAARPVETALWERFHTAQQTFFARRSAAFAERDADLHRHQEEKERLLAEAEALDPAGDLAAAKRRLREIQERWEKVGPVPRDARPDLEKRLAAAEQRIRAATDDRWSRPNLSTSPLVERLHESVAKLERRIERARAAGRHDEAADAEAALTTQREWLARAERG